MSLPEQWKPAEPADPWTATAIDGEHARFAKEGLRPDSLISDVPPIPYGGSDIPKDAEHLRCLVEYPLLRACQELYRKGVLTEQSSANREDLHRNDHAWFCVDYHSLSDRNQPIAEALGEVTEVVRYVLSDGRPKKLLTHQVLFQVPIDEATRVVSIEGHALEITGAFKPQPAVWVPRYALAELQKMYEDKTEESTVTEFEAEGFVFDRNLNLFFLSSDHRERTYIDQARFGREYQRNYERYWSSRR